MTDIKAITEQLERGVKDVYASGRYQSYLDCMAKFHDYSTNNIILIMLQKPDASLVAGYKAWQTKFHRNVRKGEKGIRILAPSPKKFVKTVTDDEGNVTEKEISYMSYYAVSVFDISQTDGEDLPLLTKQLRGNVDGFADMLVKLTSVSPVPVGFENIADGANGYFSHDDQKICVKDGMSELQTIKTLIHEIAHAMMHDDDDGSGRETKEVQAESVSYAVCKMLGLDTSDYSFGYIAGWASDKETKQLSESMDVIRKTAKKIFEGYNAA